MVILIFLNHAGLIITGIVYKRAEKVGEREEIQKMSKCAPKPEENTQMRSSKSNGFLIRSGWTFVGCCKRAWYKIRMHLYCEKKCHIH
ncbi:hypothetical protein AAZX31_01G111600 [Glycine max]